MCENNEIINYDELNEYSEKGKKGFAITSLVLGILSLLLVCCCFWISIILAILSIIFGIISIVKKQAGKGMSIAGLITSGIALILSIILIILTAQFSEDISKFSVESDEVIYQYEETGELPDYLEKYTDEKYDYIWENLECEDFYEFFELVTETYNS